MLKRFSILLLFLVAQTALAFADDTPVIYVPEDDPVMNAAIDKSRQTLDCFLNLVINHSSEISDPSLKVFIKDENGAEHFWVRPFHFANNRFSGTIDNEPAIVKIVTYGQEIRFTRNDVTDWMYMKNGKTHGAFTLRVMIPRMSSEDAATYSGMLAQEDTPCP